jgi:hypothetical protein
MYTNGTFYNNGTGYNGTIIDDDPLDCFINVNDGAYKVCTTTQKISIASSIMFLMAQLLISRIIFPGVSNFLNASVRTPPLHARGGAACHAPDDSPFDGCFLYALQVLRSDSSQSVGESGALEASDDEQRSTQVVAMTPQ